MSKIRFIAAVALLLSVAGCTSTRKASRPMLDWEPGTSYSYEIIQGQTQSIEIPGQGTQENSTRVQMDLNVSATAPYRFTINVTDATSEGSPISADPLKGLESQIETDNRGTITSATGLADNSYITERGGEDLFIDDLQLLFIELPEETLAPGVSWTRDVSTPFSQRGLNLKRSLSQRYTCTKLTTFDEKPAFEISIESDAELSGGGNQGGQDMDVSMNGTFSGTIYVDPASGALLSMDQKGTMIGAIDLPQASLPITMDMFFEVKQAE